MSFARPVQPKDFFKLAALVLTFVITGCDYFVPNPPCPPPPSIRPPLTKTYLCDGPTTPPILPDPEICLGLSDLLDLALQNSPKTRAAWYRSKQGAADVGIARGAYLPPVIFTGYWVKENIPTVIDTTVFNSYEKKLAAQVSTGYLIFDFGGRNGNLMSALSALCQLNWAYNWEVQTVMINVIQSYYDYLNAKAFVTADLATVRDNLKTVEAATCLRQIGVKGLADQLQAETSLVQSQIVYEQDLANLNIARATLIQSIGLPPDSALLISELPDKIAVEGICQDMAHLLQAAKENRADLMAARADVLVDRYRIRTARSVFYPNLVGSAFGAKQSINCMDFADAYALQFTVNYALFSSFADVNNLRKAQAALLETQANLDDQELAAFLSVLSDYYELVANREILKYSYKYESIANKNREVAFANYKVGVNTIIDLMIANNALNDARKQLANSKTNFLTSLANLSYDTGGLTISDVEPLMCSNPLLDNDDENNS